MINSRDVNDLNPTVMGQCHAFIAACKSQNIDVIITSTYRDNQAQQFLYAQGRTVDGPKVTHARPGQSAHNYRLAFDFCAVVNGKAEWNNPHLYARCGALAKSVGLEWAGDWVSFPELVHCQNLLGKPLQFYRDTAHKVVVV